jgi:hypothetical protein
MRQAIRLSHPTARIIIDALFNDPGENRGPKTSFLDWRLVSLE